MALHLQSLSFLSQIMKLFVFLATLAMNSFKWHRAPKHILSSFQNFLVLHEVSDLRLLGLALKSYIPTAQFYFQQVYIFQLVILFQPQMKHWQLEAIFFRQILRSFRQNCYIMCDNENFLLDFKSGIHNWLQMGGHYIIVGPESPVLTR